MVLGVGQSGIQSMLLNNNARATRDTDRAAERLTTGLRINRASDDPAGLIAAEQLRGSLIETNAETKVFQAQRRQNNIQQSGRQVASNVLNEVRGLLVQASNGVNSAEEVNAIQGQIDSSLDSLDRLGSITGFALPASLDALRSGGSGSVADGNSAEGAELLEEELSAITLASAAAGAYEKYTLDVGQRLAEDKAVALASALSETEDANYAQESSNLVRGQILTEASIKTMALTQKIKADQIELLFELL